MVQWRTPDVLLLHISVTDLLIVVQSSVCRSASARHTTESADEAAVMFEELGVCEDTFGFARSTVLSQETGVSRLVLSPCFYVLIDALQQE